MSKDPWCGIRGNRCAFDGAAARARAFEVAAAALQEALTKQAARDEILKRVTEQQRAFYKIESIPVSVLMGKHVRKVWGGDVIAGLQIELDQENDDALMVCAIERQFEMPNAGLSKKDWIYPACYIAMILAALAWVLS